MKILSTPKPLRKSLLITIKKILSPLFHRNAFLLSFVDDNYFKKFNIKFKHSYKVVNFQTQSLNSRLTFLVNLFFKLIFL